MKGNAMGFDRRNFIKTVMAGTAAGMAANFFGIKGVVAADKGESMNHQEQVPGIYRTKIGDIELTSIFDGGMEMGPAIVLNADEKEIKRMKDKAFIQESYIPGYLNSFVVKARGKLILIDTGYGKGAGATGQLLKNLAAAGFKPEMFDEILLTHAHPDHVGGMVDDTGALVFKNASVRLSEKELSFWYDDAQKSKFSEKAIMFDAARKNLGPYKDAGRIGTFKDNADLGGGLWAVDLPGHTPGHSGFRVSSGDEDLLIWGDIIHMQSLQFAHPEWGLSFDIDAEQAKITRRKILDKVVTDRTRIGGMHLSFPGLGHVEKSGEVYAFAPQKWEAKL